MNERRSFPDVFPLGRGTGDSNAHPSSAQVLTRREDFSLARGRVRPSIRMIEGPAGHATAEPKVMMVLLALVDAQGEVLTREDLIQRCWHGVVVGDDAINRAIAEVRRIARETGAGFVVETIPRTGYRLVDPESSVNAPTKASSSHQPAFTAQPSTRRAIIVGGLAISASGLALWSIRSRHTDPATALIKEARLAMRWGNPATDKQATVLLEHAVSKSPQNAEAWGLLALVRARTDEHAISRPVAPASMVTSAAHKALDLDPANADAMAAIAIATPYYGDWLAAERRFDAVIRRYPDQLFARDSRSFLLGAVGRMRQSAVDRLGFSPATPFDAGMHYRQIYCLWFLDRITEADRLAWRGMEMWPKHPGIWFARLWVLAGTGRFDRALAHINDEATRPPLPPPMITTLSRSIRAALTRNVLDREAATGMIMAGVANNVAGVVNGMMLLNILGSIDEAFALADAYYLERGPIIASMTWRPGQPVVPDQRRRKTNMMFTPVAADMRRDHRFPTLMADMGLTDYWARRGIQPDYLTSPES